jgi:uncharacterized RDD family membrane protein YckC
VSATTGVRTVPPDARAFQGRTAGIVSRIAAGGIDLATGVAVCAAAYVTWVAIAFLAQGRDFRFPTVRWTTAIVAYGVVMVVYLATAWRASGRTRGNRVLGLRVVTLDDARLGTTRALVRAVLTVVFPLLLGWAAVSRDRRSVQDLVLGTKVIYDWQGRVERPSGPRAPQTTRSGRV